MSLIKNPTTGTYLEMARSVGQLFRQGGGSLPFENLTEPGSLGDPKSIFIESCWNGYEPTNNSTKYSGDPLSMNPELHFH